MKVSKVAGVIAAGSKQAAFPMLRVGNIPVVKRIVIMFQQAGIFPIVIVTGAEEDDVRYLLSNSGVIFLHNEKSEAPQLLDSAKIGFEYLQDKCDRVAFVPVNVPMFSPNTLKSLLDKEGDIITPSYNGKGGHPIMLSVNLIPEILKYQGENGLRGFIALMENKRICIEVEDEGMLYTVHDYDFLLGHLDYHNREILHPVINLSLEKESLFFNPRAKLLLMLISDTHSVRSACNQMCLSYSKAWDILNKLEQELGYPMIQRRQGGSHGGKTELTQKGYYFLKAYHKFEEKIFKTVQEEFKILMKKNGVFL